MAKKLPQRHVQSSGKPLPQTSLNKTLLSRKKRILLHFMPRWPSKSVQNLHFTLLFHVFRHVLYISSYLENRSRCGETSKEILMEITHCAETHGLLEAPAPCCTRKTLVRRNSVPSCILTQKNIKVHPHVPFLKVNPHPKLPHQWPR